jgi:histidine triad (HIT) family protein
MRLSDPYDPDNIFARILRNEMPSWKVYEDEHALAFLDIFPQGPGHVLVIPKVAATNILGFPAEHFGPYMTAVQKVAKAVQHAFSADGMTIFQFNGAAGGQSVFHLHFHIVPRFEGIALTGHGHGGKANDEDLQAHAKAITASLAQLDLA